MNLRDLQYLVTIADEGSFGGAAERCHVSQSTLSIQIKKLEDFLGVQLFERNNKRVMLTAIGERVYERARLMLQQSDEIRQIARDARDPMTGDITLGAFPTLAPYLFPLCINAIKKHLPRVKLRLVEEKTSVLLDMLAAGKVDCALLAAPISQQGIKSIELFHEPFYIAAPAKHPVTKKKSLTDEDLGTLDLLLLDEGHCLRSQALEICHSIGTGEASKFRATSLETLRHMVGMGDAMTLMPKLAVNPDDADIRYIPLRNPALGRTIALCYRDTSGQKSLFDALGETIRKSVQ